MSIYEDRINRNFLSKEEMDALKPHILVVDDNAMVLRNIKGILKDDFSVSVASSGNQAFRSISFRRPDLILLDYEMPEMNGKEVMEKILEDDEMKDIPIVFLTSLDSKQRVMEILALKPAGYILKPPDAAALTNKIREILRY